MSSLAPTTPTRTAVVAGLGLASVGIAVQIATGVDYPTVPPGLVVLLVPAVLVLLVRARWPLLLAAVASAFLLVGGTLAPSFRHHLSDPSDLGPFLGSAVQEAGMVLALVAALAALVTARRGATS